MFIVSKSFFDQNEIEKEVSHTLKHTYKLQILTLNWKATIVIALKLVHLCQSHKRKLKIEHSNDHLNRFIYQEKKIYVLLKLSQLVFRK